MKNLMSALTIAIGLATVTCAGAQKQTADPSASSDGRGAGRNNAAGDGDRSSESSTSSAPSESSLSSASSGSPESSETVEHKSTDSSGGDDRPAKVEQKDEKGGGECQKSSAGLVLTVDRKTVSLEEGRLQAKMDGPICSLVMRITRKDGLPTVEKTFSYTGPEQELRWTPVPRDQIEKVEIRITAKNNAYQAVWLVPWSVSIDHKEVQFDTNKAIIRDSEVASLNESLAKIKEVLAKVEGKGLGTITLFIAGHTDTVGSDEHNMTLSRNRAQAIADWFMKRGLCIPIAFEGFGETALKKLTADNVAEQANRRVDYILAVEPPTVKKGATPAWKLMSKGC
jgi:outer membrane protein OmpA-like peptidoglycan-associated protein